MHPNHDEFDDLTKRLQAERPSPPVPDAQFSHTLRHQLLAHYDQPPPRWPSFNRLTYIGTTAAVLALIILIGWFVSQKLFIGPETSSPITTTRSIVVTPPSPSPTPIPPSPSPPPEADYLEIIQFSPPTSTPLTGTTPITFEVALFYRLQSAPEATINIAMMPMGGGASMFFGFEEVTQGEGNLTLTFSFNPKRDLSLQEPKDFMMLANMGLYNESSSNNVTFATTSPHDSLEDVWHYQP